MDVDQLRAIYDQEQRRDVTYPGFERQVLPPIIRHVTEGEGSNILFTDLDQSNADAVIEEQLSFFGKRPFEWKCFAHDQPADLKDRLARHGLTIGDAEAILILDLESAPEFLFAPITHSVRRITDPDRIPAILTVQDQVFGEGKESTEDDWIARQLAEEMRLAPDQVSVYAAYVDSGVSEGDPSDTEAVACSAWIRFPENNRFASLWGAATLPAYRQRGYYTAVMAIRIQEARQRGRRFVTVDASPMSRPILEKYGFQWITTSYPCQWHGKK